MIIHSFGKEDKPVMILIHGILTPWQIWNAQIEYFKEEYYMLVVALDAHTEEESSEFISLSDEANKIEEYCYLNKINKIDVLVGLSLGGAIAQSIWKNQRIEIGNLILDGAPLVSFPKIIEKIMITSYLNIIHKSKMRDRKIIDSFKKQFLPEKYLESYLKIADKMSDNSVRNLVYAANNSRLGKVINNKSKILFLYGTKGNEILSRKSAKLMKKAYPEVVEKCYQGDAHCYKAIYEPDIWIKDVESFLIGKS